MDASPGHAGSAATRRAWPEAVWSAPVLRGLDERARAELEAAGALRDLAAGEPIFRGGEPADAFFVVTEGAVAVRAVRRGDAESTVIRRAARGEAFGEEAVLTGFARTMEAVADGAAQVASIPVLVFRRAVERAGEHAPSPVGAPAGEGAALLARHERLLRRAATRDLLRTMSFTRELGEDEQAVLLDAIQHIRLARGEPLYREHDPPAHVYFVADGMLQIQTEDAGRIHVRAYLARGDVAGDTEAESGAPHATSAVASGSAWILGLPRHVFQEVVARNPSLLPRIRRVRVEQEAAQQRVADGAHTTQHVFKDLYRLHVARSLLVIDQTSCVRCGHCAWSCADAHADGVSRLVRRGDVVVTRVAEGPRAVAPLLLPSSCQHCENPACMPDCPTGAIGRDARGEVFIREELCTGCGACAKGCPWGNIQLAPRQGGQTTVATTAAGAPGLSAEVAVKCDLCRDLTGGPACVAACPTEAIARVNPSDVLPDVQQALGHAHAPAGATARVLPRPPAAWPQVAGGVLGAIALAALPMPGGRGGALLGGALAGALVLALIAYAGVKRLRRVRSLAGAGRNTRPWMIGHVALGFAAMGAVVQHAGLSAPGNPGGALAAAFWGLTLTGAFGAAAYRWIPERLTRLERTGALPEDLAGRTRDLDERIFRELTGRSDLVKLLYARVLRPYRERWLGPLTLIARGLRLTEEQGRLRRRIDRALDGRGGDKLEGLDGLVRIVVERRAVAAQRLLAGALRGWLPPHVVLAALALVMLVLHGVLAGLGR